MKNIGQMAPPIRHARRIPRPARRLDRERGRAGLQSGNVAGDVYGFKHRRPGGGHHRWGHLRGPGKSHLRRSWGRESNIDE